VAIGVVAAAAVVVPTRVFVLTLFKIANIQILFSWTWRIVKVDEQDKRHIL